MTMNGPSPAGSDEFLAVQRQTGADVAARLHPVRRSASGSHRPDIRRATGPSPCCKARAICLIARAVLEGMAPPWFDPAFALTGGEDHDFFVRLARPGARFAWADDAARPWRCARQPRQAGLGADARLFHRQFRHAGAAEASARPGLLLRESGKIAGRALVVAAAGRHPRAKPESQACAPAPNSSARRAS